MDGTMHVIDQLGLAHKAALQVIARLEQENEHLRAALAERGDVAVPDDRPSPPT